MTIKTSEKETLTDVGPCALKFLSVGLTPMSKGFTSF